MKKAQLLIVLGSNNSSNSNRLKEIALKLGKKAYLIDGAWQIKKSWFNNINIVSVTAGASAPEELVLVVIKKLKDLGATSVQEVDGEKEKITFSLPKELR